MSHNAFLDLVRWHAWPTRRVFLFCEAPSLSCLAAVITFSEVQFRLIYTRPTIAPLRPLRSQNAFVFHDGAFWRDVEADPRFPQRRRHVTILKSFPALRRPVVVRWQKSSLSACTNCSFQRCSKPVGPSKSFFAPSFTPKPHV